MSINILKQKWLIRLFIFVVIIAAAYGSGRLYYRVTGGFTISNITAELPYDPRWDMRPLTTNETSLVDSILSQKFRYLGKGCQSYVFLSDDGNYVIKFFKYQRFRTQPWVNFFSFIPAVDRYRLRKVEKKQNKLEGFYSSWKIAFEDLMSETGLVYIHLNKSTNLNKTLVINDKMGFEHRLDIDKYEFLIQRKAQMLCPYIRKLMDNGDVAEAHKLLDRIIALIITEYQLGYADNDHALMQNTGVLEGRPIHIDVGQFVRNENAKDPAVYKQDLFSKTFKFRRWLKKEYPELVLYLEYQLKAVIGDQFDTMKPHFKMHDA